MDSKEGTKRSYRGMMDGWHGDEHEIEYESQMRRDYYDDKDDWKYESDDER